MSDTSSISRDPAPSAMLSRRWRWILIVVIATSFGLGGAWMWLTNSASEPLPSGVSPREYELAREAFEVKYGRTADRLDVLSWLAEWLLARQRPADAIACFAAIPTSHPKYGRMARFQQGRTLLDLHRAIEAEQQFRELIALEEASPTIKPEYLIDARQRLRHILEVELRFEERQQLLRGVIERGEEDTFEAVAGCFPSLLRWNGPDADRWLNEFHAANPTNPVLNIALGRYLTGHGKTEEARKILEAVVREQPRNLSAQAALIECLRESDDPEESSSVLAKLPSRSPEDPWLLLLQRGTDAIQNGRPQDALEAYTQLLKQNRTSPEAWQGLAQAARLLNDAPRRTKALEMGTALGRIQNRLGKSIQEASDPSSFLDVAELCAEVSLNHEGWIMTKCARRVGPESERMRKLAALFQERLAVEHTSPSSAF